MSGWLERLLRDRTTHFLLLGGLLFALYAARAEPDDRTIVIDGELVSRLEADHRRRTGAEVVDRKALVDAYVSSEIFFREARRLGLTEGDEVVRRRAIQLFELLVDDLAAAEPPSDEELREHYRATLDRYRRPPRVSGRHVFFRSLPDDSEAITARLAAGETVAGEAFLRGPTFRQRDASELAAWFGDPAANTVMKAPVGTWRGPVRSPLGVHWFFVERHHPPEVLAFETVEASVRDSLETARRREARERLVARLRDRYSIQGGP